MSDEMFREIFGYSHVPSRAPLQFARDHVQQARVRFEAALQLVGFGMYRQAQDVLVTGVDELLAATLLAAAASELAWSALDDDGRAVPDVKQYLDVCGIVDGEPTAGIVDRLRHVLGGALHGVRDAVVDDCGHEDSPSVGSVDGGTSPAGGAGERACSSADVPTVGVPTDAPAGSSPSPAGASVLADDIAAVVSRDVMDVPRLAHALYELGWRR